MIHSEFFIGNVLRGYPHSQVGANLDSSWDAFLAAWGLFGDSGGRCGGSRGSLGGLPFAPT